MLRLTSSLACTFAALASTAMSQATTWVVDSANGPGTNFTTLIAAEAAAADGDILLVRHGNYSGFDTSKGLTILGERAGFLPTRINPASGATNTIRVHNVPATSSFRIAECDIRTTSASGLFGAGAALRIENCLGSVLVDDVIIDGFPADGGAGISTTGATQVHITGSQVYGRPAVHDRGGSRCTIVDSALVGGNATTGLGGVLLHSSAPGAEIATFNGASSLRLVRSSVAGGNGATTQTIVVGGSPAVRVVGTVIVAGDATTQLIAGSSSSPVSGIAGGLTGGFGSVIVDPAVSVQGAAGGPAFDPGLAVTSTHVPWLIASGEGPGGQVSYTLGTTPNNPAVVLLSLPSLPAPTPFGDLELNPLAIAPLFSGSQPPSGLQSQNLNVPPDPGLLGQTFAVQAGVFDNASSVLGLTNSAQFLLY